MRSTERPSCGVEDVGNEPLSRLFVEMGSRLVEEENGRVCEERARDDEALALSSGELRPLLADPRVQPVRKRADPVVQPSSAERFVEVDVRCVGAGEPQVLTNRRVEHVRLLPRERKGAADVLLSELAEIATVDRHAPRLGIEEAEKEVRDGRLARAARADERHPPARVDSHGELLEDGLRCGRVPRGDALQRDGDLAARGGSRIARVGHHGLTIR